MTLDEFNKLSVKEQDEYLTLCQYAYYVLNEPIEPDSYYDAFFRSLKSRWPKAPSVNRVGADMLQTNLEKARHVIPMLSIDNITNEDDVEKFFEKYNKDVMASYKMDGLSVELVYKNGVLRRAVTRGKGGVGENVTRNCYTIKDIPKKLKEAVDIVVRGEVYMKRSVFKKLIDSGLAASNPRNLAAGSLKTLDIRITKKRNLSFAAHGSQNLSFFKTEQDRFDYLEKLGIPTVFHKRFTDINKFKHFLNKMETKRGMLDYDIDGIVFIANSIDLQNKLGYTSRDPRFGRAFKFKPSEEKTVVENIVLQPGITWKLTPVAILKPVSIAGTIVSKATLHNLKYVNSLQVKPGSTVVVSRRGDVIPAVESVVENKGKWNAPDICPFCKGKTKQESVFLYCTNEKCSGVQFKRILVQIKILGIDNIGPKIVKKLLDKKLITDIADVFALKRKDLMKIEGVGYQLADKIIKNIEEKKKMPLSKFINLLIIPNIGNRMSEQIANKIKTFDNLINITSLNDIEGIGSVKEKSFLEGVRKSKNLINRLKHVIEIIDEQEKKGKLQNVSFCFTGRLSIKRSQAEKMVLENGGKVKPVSRNLTYLVAGELDSNSSKLEKAKKLGVKIINEQEFLNIVQEKNKELEI